MTASRALRIVVGAGAVLMTSNVNAQSPRQPPSPVLLKRLAEAMDGNRTGVPMYVVASYDSLSPVRGVFTTRPPADSLVRILGTSYDVFGPFVAPFDPGAEWMFFGCVHDQVRSILEVLAGERQAQPPALRPQLMCPDKPVHHRDVVGLTLMVRMRDGSTREVPLAPTADAIFLTMPAIDKFVIPYYARTIGADSVSAMRRRIVQGLQAP